MGDPQKFIIFVSQLKIILVQWLKTVDVSIYTTLVIYLIGKYLFPLGYKFEPSQGYLQAI
jgi:hypothetical protein